MYEEEESLEYDILTLPGADELQITVIKKVSTEEDRDESDTSWGVVADTVFIPKLYENLYGWYAESGRKTGTEVSHQLFASSRIEHSELIIVLSNGIYLPTFERYLVEGKLIKKVEIVRFSKIEFPFPSFYPFGSKFPIQLNSFEDCYVTSVQQIIDYIVVCLRISKKSVTCTAFSQDGMPRGVGSYSIDFNKAEPPSGLFW